MAKNVARITLCQYHELYFRLKFKPMPSIEFKMLKYSYPCNEIGTFMSQMSNLGQEGNDSKGNETKKIKKTSSFRIRCI